MFRRNVCNCPASFLPDSYSVTASSSAVNLSVFCSGRLSVVAICANADDTVGPVLGAGVFTLEGLTRRVACPVMLVRVLPPGQRTFLRPVCTQPVPPQSSQEVVIAYYPFLAADSVYVDILVLPLCSNVPSSL